MLYNLHEVLPKASQQKYAVAAPNVFNLETVETSIRIADELKSPVIVSYYEMEDDDIIFEIARMTEFFACKYSNASVVLHLDHGKSFHSIIRAIRAGFTSVMIDRSQCTFAENAEETQEICKIAHAVGVTVEAELGHVGAGASYEEERESGLTRVHEVSKFINMTGIDCLAPAIGTAHGPYKGKPKLDFNLLKEIKEAANIPLALHGGSSTGDENLKKTIEMGINKVNIFSDLSFSGVEKMRQVFSKKENPHIMELFAAGAQGYGEMLQHYIKLFGSAGKA